MNPSTHARTLLRLSPLALAAAVMSVFAIAAANGTVANASPVHLANMRLMDHAVHSDAPRIHTMVVPAAAGVDASASVSGAALARRAGLETDSFAEPVVPRENPALVSGAATAPAGKPHMSDLLSRHVAPSCTGTGTDGPRVQVVYAYETGAVDDLARKEATIRNEIANIDDVFALSSAETGGGRRVRWVADANCLPQIITAVVPVGSISSAGSTNSASYWNALKANLINAGLDRSDRKYLVFGDAPSANPAICGLGDMYVDEAPTGNANDGYAAQFGVVFQACFAASANNSTYAGHELVHTLGAVQRYAPNASQFGHCTDDGDLMCYPDGSTTSIRQVCPESHEPLLDCNNDDYFSTNPRAGSYLATRWNTANSSFLDTVTALTPTPALTLAAPVTSVAGQPVTVTATMTPTPQAFEWLRNGVLIPGATGPTYTFTPQSYETGVATLTVRATLADGRKVTTSRSLTITMAPAPFVDITGPATVASGTDIAFTAAATGSAPFTYAWTYPSSYCTPKGSADTATIIINCRAPGTLTMSVGVTATQADGQSADTALDFTVTPVAMTVTIDGPSTLTVGQSATYTANVQNVPAGWTVSWNDSPANPTWIEQGYFTSPSTKVTARSTGTTTLEAFVYSSQTGQSIRLNRTIQGVAAPTASITGPASTPAGYSASFRGVLSGASTSTYLWTSTRGWIDGENTTPVIAYTPTGVGGDTLTLTVTTTTGARISTSMTVTATAAFTAAVTVPPTVTPGRAASISVTPNRTSTVLWNSNRTDCVIAEPRALSTTVTCAQPLGDATLTASLTDTVTGQILVREATTSVGPNSTTMTLAATGTNPVILSTVLTDAVTKAPIVGVPVTVQRAAYGATSYATVATVLTGTEGKATYSAPATAAATYRFVFAGGPTAAASTSAAIAIKVPTTTVLSVVNAYPTTFTGQSLNAATKKPVAVGTALTLRVKWYGTTTWANVVTLRTDVNGRATWKWNANRNGYFQLINAGDASATSSTSAITLVRIPTKVTMTVKAGRPDVISARLTTGAGVSLKSQYVTLQYRAYGTTTWRTVTRIATTSTGAVSVRTQPKRRTQYRWVYSGTSTGFLPATSTIGVVAY